MALRLKSKVENSNSEHALLSPSGAAGWLNCAAKLAVEAGLPDTSGKAARDGTAMHYMAEKWLQMHKEGRGHMVTPSASVGLKVEGVKVTEDMVKMVSGYVDFAASLLDAAVVFEVEQRVSLSKVLHPDDDSLETFGTADLVAVAPDGTAEKYVLVVGDLKTGRNAVSAEQNLQLMLYACGLLRRYRRIYDIDKVKLIIYQPLAGGVSEWDTSVDLINAFAVDAAHAASRALKAYRRGKKGLKPEDFTPGDVQCRWCKFAEKCNVKRAAVHNELAPEKIEMTPGEVAAEYRRLDFLRQHIKSVEAAMYKALLDGEKLPGYKLVAGRPGNRKWEDEEEVREKYGDTVVKEVMLSPKEAEEAGVIPADELDELVTREPGKPTIAPADDKREAWRPESIRDMLEDDDE